MLRAAGGGMQRAQRIGRTGRREAGHGYQLRGTREPHLPWVSDRRTGRRKQQPGKARPTVAQKGGHGACAAAAAQPGLHTRACCLRADRKWPEPGSLSGGITVSVQGCLTLTFPSLSSSSLPSCPTARLPPRPAYQRRVRAGASQPGCERRRYSTATDRRWRQCMRWPAATISAFRPAVLTHLLSRPPGTSSPSRPHPSLLSHYTPFPPCFTSSGCSPICDHSSTPSSLAPCTAARGSLARLCPLSSRPQSTNVIKTGPYHHHHPVLSIHPGRCSPADRFFAFLDRHRNNAHVLNAENVSRSNRYNNLEARPSSGSRTHKQLSKCLPLPTLVTTSIATMNVGGNAIATTSVDARRLPWPLCQGHLVVDLFSPRPVRCSQ